MGNGHLTAVYSDDARITTATGNRGIQHLYFRDYTADYVISTAFMTSASSITETGMKNFFTVQSKTPRSGGGSAQVLCYVHPGDAVVLSVAVTPATAHEKYQLQVQLRKEIKTDSTVQLTSFEKTDQLMLAFWSNGTVIAIAPKSPNDDVSQSGASVVVSGDSGPQASQVLLIPASSRPKPSRRLKSCAAITTWKLLPQPFGKSG